MVPFKNPPHPVCENGVNVPWVGVPVRVIVKLLVELSRNVLFCCPFVPVVSKSATVLLK